MRFGKIIESLAVPEWKQCYIDYQNLKILVIIIKNVVQLVQKTQKNKNVTKHSNNKRKVMPQVQQVSYQNLNQLQNSELKQPKKQIQSKIHTLQEILQESNYKFYQIHQLSTKIFQTFIHMKYYQMKEKFLYYVELSKYPNLSDPENEVNINYLYLVEYNYIQTCYLSKMYQIVTEGERKILKKHKKYSNSLLQTPKVFHQKIDRVNKLISTLKDNIQDHYIKFNNVQSKKSRQYLRSLSQVNQHHFSDSFLFGLFIGFTIAVVIILIFMLSNENMLVNQIRKQRFNRDFPTWRGVAFFIFYIWILAINIWAYQSYCVNHKLIFKFQDHHSSTSTQIFQVAGKLSTIFLILFLLYSIQLNEIINIGTLPPQYLAMFAWGSLLIYIFMPLPIFNHKGRIFTVKLLVKCVASPLVGVTFPIIFGTDQIITLITPIKDMVYTFCYYNELNLNDYKNNNCSDSNKPLIVVIISIVVNSLRILQCMKQGYDSGKYIGTGPFYNSIKYSFSMLTALLSYVYKNQSQNIFAAWIVSAAISTLYSYIWDLKMDWALFEDGAKYRFLRKYITFGSPYNYYFVMVANFLLRLAWVLTLSPSIVESFSNAQLFTLATGGLEIIRRGLWNLLRVQRQHLANCGNFQAFPNVGHIQKKLQQECIDRLHTNKLIISLIELVLKDKKENQRQYPNPNKIDQHLNNIKQFYGEFMSTLKYLLNQLQSKANQLQQYKQYAFNTINITTQQLKIIKNNL